MSGPGFSLSVERPPSVLGGESDLIEGTPEILLCMFRLNCMRALILVGSRGTPFPSCFGVSFLVEEPLEVLGPGLSALFGLSVTI